MIAKERVQKALKHEKVDRVPIYMWFHPATRKQLSSLLEIPQAYVEIAMANDVQQTWVNNNYVFEHVDLNDDELFSDPWGIKWEKQGYFNQISNYPLENSSYKQILQYTFPTNITGALIDRMIPIIARREDYFIGCDVSPCAFAMYARLRGMENALIDIALQPSVARNMLEKCIEFASTLAQEAIDRYSLDWLWTGDDVASGKNMLFKPEFWRENIKPGLKKLFSIGKSNNLWVAYHCCGAMRNIIPDLIEIGMDVLNPIQSTCPGMNPLELKKEFGSQIAFMGGLDTQNLLPSASFKEVKRATEKLILDMTLDGGGFILAGTHTVPPETPIENIFAVYETIGIQKEEIFDNAATIRKSHCQ
jgi:uroporphyrinogen decarboxylase